MKDTKTPYDDSNNTILSRSIFGLLYYHSNYLYITRIFSYIYSFYEEIINYVNNKINSSDLKNFNNIHQNFYEGFINTFKNKHTQLKSDIGTIPYITNENLHSNIINYKPNT